MKRTLALLLAIMMVLGLVACAKPAEGDDNAEPAAKPVIKMHAFTDEIPNMIHKYIETHPDFAEKYDFQETIVATDGGAYQQALDQALAAGGEDAPDMYAAEAAFVLKYAQGDAADYAATYEDLGINVASEAAAAKIAQYSIDIGTRPADGKVVGLGYQANGGCFIYRTDIAQEVFGTSDSDAIAELIGAGSGNWDKFFEAAETLKGKGYAMLSGDGDLWHSVENSSDSGWVVDGKLNIDPKREEFFELSKKLKDNGYHNDTTDWTEAWYADMAGTGEKQVFGFFGPAWLINYTIGQNCGGTKVGEGTYGKWHVCAPPVGFFWGGTWILANKNVGDDVKDGVAELIRWITLDPTETGLQYLWASGTIYGEGGTKDCVASAVALEAADGTMDFLGGQNAFEAFVPALSYANGKCLTQYDETINTLFRDQVRAYTAGEKDKDAAIADFKTAVGDQLDIVVE